MDLLVCIGSACHLKGSYDVIEQLKALIARDGLEEKIVLKASFCLGHCGAGVTVKAGDEYIAGVSPESIESVYESQIKAKV